MLWFCDLKRVVEEVVEQKTVGKGCKRRGRGVGLFSLSQWFVVIEFSNALKSSLVDALLVLNLCIAHKIYVNI